MGLQPLYRRRAVRADLVAHGQRELQGGLRIRQRQLQHQSVAASVPRQPLLRGRPLQRLRLLGIRPLHTRGQFHLGVLHGKHAAGLERPGQHHARRDDAGRGLASPRHGHPGQHCQRVRPVLARARRRGHQSRGSFESSRARRHDARLPESRGTVPGRVRREHRGRHYRRVDLPAGTLDQALVSLSAATAIRSQATSSSLSTRSGRDWT